MPRYRLTKLSCKNDPFIQQLFASIPPQTAAGFTDTQLSEIKRILKNAFSNCYAVDIRFFIPLPKQRFSMICLFHPGKRFRKCLQYTIYKHKNRVLVTQSSLFIITSLMDTLCMVEIVPQIDKHLGPERTHKFVHHSNDKP